ncbi:MAG: PLP-dependent aminotransferase family protein, partial [Burkholderiales bacterium]|nr:PLP-dependent aminotransferase family protein [Burkholderiales bacterium]
TDLIASGGLDRHLRRMRAVFRLQVQRMTDAIERHFPEGTRITRPAGGFVLWVELPPSIDTLALFWKALERGVSIAPGTMFSASGGCTHHLRLSCGMPFSDTIERAIRTLGELAATD